MKRGSASTTAFLATAMSLLGAASLAQQPTDASGDAERGEALFTTYKCYACHGYGGQTGERRLVPMALDQETFSEIVARSPLPAMPPYPDVPRQDLLDLYAYIRSIPLDAPPLTETAPLRDILERARSQRE